MRLPDVLAAVPAGTTHAEAVDRVLAGLGWSVDRADRVREYAAHRSEDLCGAPVTVLDAHGLEDEHVPGDEVVFPRGYGQYAAALADGLDVRTGAVVTAVVHDDERVRVSTADGATFCARHVVVTVPLGVLRAEDVTFDPPLDPVVRGAADRLGMGVYDKVFLRFPERFWGDDWVIRQQGTAGADWHSWYDMSRVTGEPVLAALLGGDGARRIETLTDDEVVAEGVAALRRMFDDVPEPEAVRITRWAADPFARGSYSYLHVGASADDHDLLATPTGRVQLAGEATWGDDPATVHGALLSGLRAASRLVVVRSTRSSSRRRCHPPPPCRRRRRRPRRARRRAPPRPPAATPATSPGATRSRAPRCRAEPCRRTRAAAAARRRRP